MQNLREERQRILRMVAEGKMSAQEAVRLLEALEARTKDNPPPAGRTPRWLRIYIRDEEDVINLKLPWRLVSWMLRLSGAGIRLIPKKARERMEEQGMSPEEIHGVMHTLEEALRELETGMGVGEDLVNIQGEDGEEVRIWLE